jgi:hypothetical protein
MLMPVVARHMLKMITLLATSSLMALSGAAAADARGAPVTTPVPTTGDSTITVTVWGNGLKAGSAGSGGGTSDLPIPAPCWMTAYFTGQSYFDYVTSGEMALDSTRFDGVRAPEPGYEKYKDDDKGHWYGPYCDEGNWTDQNDSTGFTTFSNQFRVDNPYVYVPANQSAPQAAVPVELLRDVASSQLDVPDPVLDWNPKIAGNQGTLVNLKTWLWLDNAPQSLEVHASVLSGTQASVTATFGGMHISATGETGFACPNSGTAYAVGATSNCFLAFSRSSSALGTPTTTVTVATRWTATWEGTGVTEQPLTPSPTADPVDTEIRVDEVQTLVTGTG